MERESGFDDGRAKFGRASDVSSAARERQEQEHSHEMGTPAATQELKFHQSQVKCIQAETVSTILTYGAVSGSPYH